MIRDERSLTITFQVDPPVDWDSFVMDCETSHFEQTSWWSNVESEDGWGARYIVARDGDRIVAGALVLVRLQRKVGRVGYVFRGPLIYRELSNSESVRSSIAAAMKEFAQKEKLRVMVVAPPYDGEALTLALIDRGFIRHCPSLPPTGLPPGTLTLDLSWGIDSVEQGYRRSLRWEIRRARKKGIVVKPGTAEDLERFWEKHMALCRRRGVVSNVPGLGYVKRAWQEFHRQGRAWMFNATLEGEILSSLICLTAGKWFYAWRIGWAPVSGKFYSSQAVFAQAIRAASEAGYRFFDFMGIHPEEGFRISHGERPNTPNSGVTFFKLGFGGTIGTLPAILDWFPNPVLRFFMRTVGGRLLSAGKFLRSIPRRSLRK